MALFLKAILELARILALLWIYFGVVGYLLTFIKKNLNVSFAAWADLLLFLSFLIIFICWYRKKGQYNGWYPVKKQ